MDKENKKVMNLIERIEITKGAKKFWEDEKDMMETKLIKKGLNSARLYMDSQVKGASRELEGYKTKYRALTGKRYYSQKAINLNQ